jgi:hypothetical protein
MFGVTVTNVARERRTVISHLYISMSDEAYITDFTVGVKLRGNFPLLPHISS